MQDDTDTVSRNFTIFIYGSVHPRVTTKDGSMVENLVTEVLVHGANFYVFEDKKRKRRYIIVAIFV